MKKKKKQIKKGDLLINTSPEIKMSELIGEYASDYINMGETTDERQSYLNSACSAWNIAVLPEHLREEALRCKIEVKQLGRRLNVVLTPHDLRRYSATYASRNGVPLEIVSKVILRHQDLKTTQAYSGKVTESEAIRWMDVLHGR